MSWTAASSSIHELSAGRSRQVVRDDDLAPLYLDDLDSTAVCPVAQLSVLCVEDDSFQQEVRVTSVTMHPCSAAAFTPSFA